MANVWRDEEFKDYWWVEISHADLGARMNDAPERMQYLFADPANNQHFLIQNFRLSVFDDDLLRRPPDWASRVRPAYYEHMSEHTRYKKPPKPPAPPKPNPALQLLMRLSGLSETTIREIIDFEGSNGN